MKKSLKMLGIAALACVTSAFAEGGMFEGSLPENWTADVVAAVKYTRMHYSNWSEDGTSSYTWLVTYDADVQGKWTVANWRNLIDLDLGQTWTGTMPMNPFVRCRRGMSPAMMAVDTL